MTHMPTRPLHLRITDSGGSTHVEERQTWGGDGPPVPRPIVAIISREEYERERFGGKA